MIRALQHLRAGLQAMGRRALAAGRLARTSFCPQRTRCRRIFAKFLLIFGMFAVVIGLGNYALIVQNREFRMKDLIREEEEGLEQVQRLITHRLGLGIQDLLFLQELPELEDYVASRDPKELRLLEKDLIGMIRLRDDYSKITLVDINFREIMRVNNQNGDAVPVPVALLQDKSNRPYMREVQSIKPGEIYLSAFDFNYEHGRIEDPPNPTIRLVSGIFDKKKQLACVLVLSFFGDHFLHDLSEADRSVSITTEDIPSYKIWLMDSKGEWIKPPDGPFESDSSASGALLSLLNKKVRNAVLKEKTGRLIERERVLAFHRVDPLCDTLAVHPSLARAVRGTCEGKGHEWILISEASGPELAKIGHTRASYHYTLLSLLLIPGAIGSWFLSHSIVSKQDADRRTREARETLQQVTDSIPGAVFKLALGAEQKGTFQFLSRGVIEVFGLDHLACPHYDQILSLIIPSDKREYDRSLQEIFHIGGPWVCEFRIYDGHACLKWIRASASVNRITATDLLLSGIFTDVTSLKVAEMKRHASEERLDLALHAANDGLWDWNLSENTTYFSPRWMQMLGYEPNELPHHFNTWKNLIHPDDVKNTMKVLSDNIENKQNHYEIEFRMRTKSGGWKWVLSRGAVVQRDNQGRPERLVGTQTDISERKELEKNLKMAKDSAEQANKAKSSFLAIMSHELRTPMNSVCGFADSLKRTPLEPGQLDYVDKIERSAGKLLFIINDLLDYSKIEAGRLKLEAVEFDFVHNVEEALELLRPQLNEKKLEFEFVVDGARSLPVRSDPTRLHQIVVNLVANAIKFTQSGKIRVKITSRQVEGNRYEIETSVRDSGIGMSIEQQAELFQPFSQVDSSTTRKYGGTGLGLAICKRLCELMGGHIWVVSQTGKGSTFTFSLKLEAASAGAAQKVRSSLKLTVDTRRNHLPEARFNWKVLVADPDEVSRLVAVELLHEIGCEAIEISDGGQLLPERLRECSAALLDESFIRDDFRTRLSERAEQLGIKAFHIFGLTENTALNGKSDSLSEQWIRKPVDVRSLTRAFFKATTASDSNPDRA